MGGREEQCWPLVKCLVFHKQAASSYTLPETPSLRRGLKEKHGPSLCCAGSGLMEISLP